MLCGGSAFGAYILGLAFAFGWTPCLGPILGTILALAADTANPAKGVILLATYAAGLGIPFVLVAVFFPSLTGLMAWMKRHMIRIERIMGLLTINQVMVPEMFEDLYERLERFAARGINVTLKPQSDPTASHVVHGYTGDQIETMRQGFPQHWEGKQIAQIALYDDKGIKYELDQAERFNAFGFNKFEGWTCNAG